MSKKHKLFEKVTFDWTEDSIRHFVSQTALSRKMPFYIQEVGDFSTYPPYYTERENLESFQLIYTLSGESLLKYHSKEHAIKAGDVFIVDCMQHHVYFTLPDKTWDFLWIHYYGPAAVPFYQSLYKDGFSIIKPANAFLIEAAMRRVLALNLKMPVGFEAYSSLSMHTILTELYIELHATKEKMLPLSAEIESVRQYINKHLTKELSLDILATELGFSKYHLIRKFKQNLNITVNEYIIQARLNVAKELLRTTEWPIKAIAKASGIHHVSHFINLFRDRESVTPLVYRKMWQSYSRDDISFPK